ncbi:4915_t:CDS:2 [Scutellospora calospora]|uniref:4915_t:CDS:1 n=1 Tax=Scutellospora calospora TaxID=85575 RepID=A0ACA9MWR0_9GLOM|nr:4915_t:CDS:2 [Scutellospora calospora]
MRQSSPGLMGTPALMSWAGISPAAEVEVLTANEVWTIGDFWTGNVLVSSPDDQSVPKLTVLDFELAKPGTAAFDVGQMGAEMLCLAHFRYAAAVAVRIGAHLFTIMPRAWTAEYGEEKVGLALQQGLELLKIGWKRDEAALRKSIDGRTRTIFQHSKDPARRSKSLASVARVSALLRGRPAPATWRPIGPPDDEFGEFDMVHGDDAEVGMDYTAVGDD